MDRSFIEALSEQLSAEVSAEILHDNALVMKPEKFNIVSLEQYQDAPNRFRGHFSTHLVEEFGKYLAKNSHKDTVVFVDQEHLTARGIIDCGNQENPLWGEHKASVVLDETPEYEVLRTHEGSRLKQKDFIEFCEEWRDFIVFRDMNRQPIDSDEALAALRRITVNEKNTSTSEINTHKQSVSEFDEIEITALNGRPPVYFSYTCRPAEELHEMTAMCRLRFLPAEKCIYAIYHIERKGLLLKEVGYDFLALLKEQASFIEQFYCGIFVKQKAD